MNNNVYEQKKTRRVRLQSSYFSESETDRTSDSNVDLIEIEILQPDEEQIQQMEDQDQEDESIQQTQDTTVSQHETIMASQFGKETNILTAQEEQPDILLLSPKVTSLQENSSTQEIDNNDLEESIQQAQDTTVSQQETIIAIQFGFFEFLWTSFHYMAKICR
jgi:hypothetical protein